MGFMEKIIVEVLAGEHLSKRKPHCYTLEAYKETPAFIPIDISEDMVKLVAQKLLVSAGTGGMDSEAL